MKIVLDNLHGRRQVGHELCDFLNSEAGRHRMATTNWPTGQLPFISYSS